jgi:hypothetical protein
LIDNPISRSNVLTPEYLLSKVVLAEAKGANGTEENIVFYFGNIETSSFHHLRSLLTKCSFMDKDRPLTIYISKHDDEFRKKRPDIERIFEGVKKFDMVVMNNNIDLPGCLKLS